MKKIIASERIPIKLWLDDIEKSALNQAKNLANFPFSFKHISLMPDCHEGFGMPIGGVMGTKDVIVPNAVGVDIGCCMCAVKTSMIELNTNTIKNLFNKIRKLIPVGFRHHETKKSIDELPPPHNMPDNGIVNMEYESARKQLGTLGGGNHFIEIQKGSDGYIWFMIHSGSRNIGYKVAGYYNKLAKKLNQKWKSDVPKHFDLAFLPIDTREAQDYLLEMNYCIDFAFASRKSMMKNVINTALGSKLDFTFDPIINIAHNYASKENHFGADIYVHRKGATSAAEGETGIIPGSQGTNSYIVSGKGNEESFKSCSHGAGRLMGRRQAQRILNLTEESDRLNKKNIIHSIKTVKDLDEAPSAYKNINIVMKNQIDLVDPLIELKPLAVIKG